MIVRPAIHSLHARLSASEGGRLRAGVVCVALLAVVLTVAARTLAGPPQTTPALVGHSAPAFALQAEHDGRVQPGTVSLGSTRGHPVLLVFFFTLCAHCLSQVQAANTAVAQEHARGVTALYISSPAERPDIVAAYLGRLGIGAPALLDNGAAVAGHYGVRFYPTLVLVDGHGTVRSVWLGETSSAKLERAITAVD
jgi:peroxiredoxin